MKKKLLIIPNWLLGLIITIPLLVGMLSEYPPSMLWISRHMTCYQSCANVISQVRLLSSKLTERVSMKSGPGLGPAHTLQRLSP